MSIREKQIKLIDGIVNEATEQQLEGLEELLVVGDTIYGLELIFGKEEFQEGLEEFKKDIKEEK